LPSSANDEMQAIKKCLCGFDSAMNFTNMLNGDEEKIQCTLEWRTMLGKEETHNGQCASTL